MSSLPIIPSRGRIVTSVPVVGVGHPGPDIQRPHAGHGDIGGAVVTGYHTPGQEHVVPQLPLVPGEDPGPDDELHVPRFILNGHEHRTLHAPGMLPCHGPARHQHLLPFRQCIDVGGAQDVGA